LLSVYGSLEEPRNCPHRSIWSTPDAQPISSEGFVRSFEIPSPLASRNISNTQFFVFVTTRALHFPSQENFLGEIENKIHFFLVAFATDF
jgi:hypothetical protein